MQINLPDIPRPEAVTVQEYAYRRLRYAVMMGCLQPGASLTFRGVADGFGLSPTPIREAVRRLSSESAIEVLGNRRLRIPTMNLGRFEELVHLRITLEVFAAAQSFPHISARVIDDMAWIDDGMDKAIALQDVEARMVLNQAFHRRLIELNPHQAVMPMIESVWLQLGPFQRIVVEDMKVNTGADSHKDMLAAMRERDVDALVAAIEADVRDGVLAAGRRRLMDEAAAL